MSSSIEHPQVSIVLPFFDSKGYLSEAIESVLSQEGNVRWELLLVNDGSDAQDQNVARSYATSYSGQIRLLAHSRGRRRGISASRNLAIRKARAPIIAFLDADDTWYPHKLTIQYGLMQRHPEAAMVYGPGLRWWEWMGGIDVAVPALVDGYGVDCLVPGEALLHTFLRDEAQTPCIGSVMIRRSDLEAAGVFEEEFIGLYDDQVLYAKLCQGRQIYVSSECVSRYRQHGRSCCGKARLEGTGEAAEQKFREWLYHYQARQSDPRAAGGLADLTVVPG